MSLITDFNTTVLPLFKQDFGESITYRINGVNTTLQTSGALTAVIGETLFEENGPDGTVIETKSVDFHILASDLSGLSSGHRPTIRDRIDWNGDTYMPLSRDGEPLVTEQDRMGDLFVIHSKKIA